MSTKSPRRKAPAKTTAAGSPVRESAQQIWLAGLGAFNKAQEEGSKMFDALVQEGLAMQRKAQTTAQEKLSEAGQKMSRIAEEIESRASGQWGRIEGLFEQRVAQALQRLGMPLVWDVQDLALRLEAIEKKLGSGTARKASAARKAAPAKKAAARKAPARKKTG
jgi:poly(hydroxyalkanoate) granule-associated protein